LNQRIGELENVEEVFVFPNMGDGGLSIGAAWLVYAQETKLKPEPLETVLLGNIVNESEIANKLSSSGVEYKYEPDIDKKVAQLLSEGNVVVRYTERMEFGPRALCNRSILYQATEPDVNKWLNDRLSRSEFMPFAPVTLEEYADECFLNLNMGRKCANNMTMTFDCTEKMKRQSPAAIHIDGTARPQIVSKKHYPRFHRILSEYYKQTGIPSVINTSFNMHEEPIVCTIEDAVRAFLAAGLPYMAIENFLVTRTVIL
jgi:carbamoyltransferase